MISAQKWSEETRNTNNYHYRSRLWFSEPLWFLIPLILRWKMGILPVFSLQSSQSSLLIHSSLWIFTPAAVKSCQSPKFWSSCTCWQRITLELIGVDDLSKQHRGAQEEITGAFRGRSSLLLSSINRPQPKTRRVTPESKIQSIFLTETNTDVYYPALSFFQGHLGSFCISKPMCQWVCLFSCWFTAPSFREKHSTSFRGWIRGDCLLWYI